MNMNTTYLTASKEYQKGNYIHALQALNGLIGVRDDAKTYVLLAKTLIKLDMKAEAAAAYKTAAGFAGASSEDYMRRAMNLYFEAGEDDMALLIAKTYIHKARKDPEIAFILATIFLARGERGILEGLRKPLAESSNPEHVMLGLRLLNNDLHNEDNYRTVKRILRLFPYRHDIRLLYLMMLRDNCDFDALRLNFPPILNELKKGNKDVLEDDKPLSNLFWCGDEDLNRRARSLTPKMAGDETAKRRTLFKSHAWDTKKIRIGYLSADFWEHHATMKLIGNVLQRHDRDRFEIFLFCHTPEQSLELNRANREEWGQVVSILNHSNIEAVEEIRSRNIDILVDIKGHTQDRRADLLNMQTAPVHVSWIGFPGSTVNIDLDYIVGDRFVLPDSSKPHYHEKFCRLPESYQPNDSFNRPKPVPLPRHILGLPADAFVFCSFNVNRKITHEMINLWSQILKGAKNSVLWIMASNEKAQANITKEFASRGIAASRIIFSEKIPYTQHLNRLQAADLALDTFPVNGHTTTSEKLWGGLPVLSRRGTNFASRVSESLLNAIGLPELIVEDDKAYVEAAIHLYENPEKIAEYKKRLVDNRFVKPLFDSQRFCRHLEMAYETMVERAKAGLEPDHFDVQALPPRETSFLAQLA